MVDLHDVAWMRRQWTVFRRILLGATCVVWLLCSSGIILLRDDEQYQWFYVRMALLVMLLASTAVSLWLFGAAWREIRHLKRVGTEIRLEQLRAEQEKRKPKRRGHSGRGAHAPTPKRA